MRLHLVDGTRELFRAHFSKRPGHRTPAGAERKATLGLAGSYRRSGCMGGRILAPSRRQ